MTLDLAWWWLIVLAGVITGIGLSSKVIDRLPEKWRKVDILGFYTLCLWIICHPIRTLEKPVFINLLVAYGLWQVLVFGGVLVDFLLNKFFR